ncbi:MAG: class I SAM-dependent methyltransferase [Acaryochloris sp. RU_4_1]|nr:class I SAM-dependent methyltransferase [Acaryochloris sp. RU_4_1]NJR55702.1 class I SAM-dependent methyltransferase [Acaryochloris sp. CRU_2_0]
MTFKLKPDWAGENWLSRVVNFLIQTKPIYAVMKQQARKVLIKTAEQNGIPWQQTYQALNTPQTKQHLDPITNPHLTYPTYYQVPFHAYDQGNLCWSAAFEAESATYAMALRVWPQEHLTWQVAQERLRASFHQVLADYSPSSVRDILDIGCSVGISTFTLHRYYQAQQSEPVRTTGLDLSPYMLSVAQARDMHQEITWLHAQAEETGLPDESFDLIALQFVIHELPRQITQRIFSEALRLLRPGGCIALVDNNPRSPVIQNLPPALFTLMKSTEPWSDDYYTFDVESALISAGFEHRTTTASDPRHRTIVGQKPHEIPLSGILE